jgi:hypothetical protein
MCISIPQEGERIKAANEETWKCEMHYLNLGYNVMLSSRFTFCCFM